MSLSQKISSQNKYYSQYNFNYFIQIIYFNYYCILSKTLIYFEWRRENPPTLIFYSLQNNNNSSFSNLNTLLFKKTIFHHLFPLSKKISSSPLTLNSLPHGGSLPAPPPATAPSSPLLSPSCAAFVPPLFSSPLSRACCPLNSATKALLRPRHRRARPPRPSNRDKSLTQQGMFLIFRVL